jgi:hypothetical protein
MADEHGPWQKMNTAPKSGVVIYMDDDRSVGICRWDGEHWWDDDADQICYPLLWVPSPFAVAA